MFMSALDEDILARIKEVCVYIDVAGVRGTGYLIGPRHVATAWHVVQAWVPGEAHPVIIGERRDGIHRRAVLYQNKSDAKHDAAVLELDEEVSVVPLPVAQDLRDRVAWDSFGFPAVMDNAGKILRMTGVESPPPGGIPFDGMVKDIRAINDLGQQAILLASARIGGAPLQGFSGSAVVVDGAVIGHLTRFIPALDDFEKGVMDYVYACPISTVVALLDFQPAILPIAGKDEKTFGSEAYFNRFFRMMDWPAEEQAQLPCNLCTGIDSALLTLALEQSASDTVRDQFAGTAVAAAQVAVAEAIDAGNREFAILSRRVALAEDGIKKSEAQIRRIEQQVMPAPPVYAALSDEISTEQRNLYHQRYLSETRQYEQNKKRHQEEKATLPMLRNDLQHFQQTFSQERIALERRQIDIAENLERLHAAVETARGWDIETLLSRLLRQVPERESEHAAIRCFLSFLLVCSLGNVAHSWLGTARDAVEQVIKTAESNIEMWISRAYKSIGADLVARLASVVSCHTANRRALDLLNSTLNAASGYALDQALAQSGGVLCEPVIAPPGSEALVDPQEIDRKVAEYGVALHEIDLACTRCAKWIEDSETVLIRSREALNRAVSQRDEMSEAASAMAAPLTNLSKYYFLLHRVLHQSAAMEMASNFLAAYDHEVRRRLSTTVEDLMADCSSTFFLTHTADELISHHSTSRLIRAETAILDRSEVLRGRREDYKHAASRLTDLPRQYWLKYSVRWRWYLGVAVIPLLNLYCALRFFFDVGRFNPGLASANKFYEKLRNCGRQVSVFGTGFSIAFAAAWASLPFSSIAANLLISEVDSRWFWAACGTHVLAALIYAISLIRIRALVSST
ncbi:S1 family peptidase [Telluria aromaticivorans]|uniref:Trypsin-like peptidase domain-containing protein n=1 Tax=Telluria aromaticivorans TaxID=2725995 RepID=A0A7Y2P0U5_9BURK|nr:serine protease [Telluria aromaticivorans]NNG23189.1 trypsin-like peptidase domain-containing protein [Telluria aromaticivorans]